MKSCIYALAIIFCLLIVNTLAATTSSTGATAAASTSSAAAAGSTSSGVAAASTSSAAAAASTSSGSAAASTGTAATSTGTAGTTTAAGTTSAKATTTAVAGTTTANATTTGGGPIAETSYSLAVTLIIGLSTGNATLNQTALNNITAGIQNTINIPNVTVTVTVVNSTLLNSALALRFKKAFQAAGNATTQLKITINFPNNQTIAAFAGNGTNPANLNVDAAITAIQNKLVGIANGTAVAGVLAALGINVTSIVANTTVTSKVIFVTTGAGSTTAAAAASTSTTGAGSFLAPQSWLLAFGFVSTLFALIL